MSGPETARRWAACLGALAVAGLAAGVAGAEGAAGAENPAAGAVELNQRGLQEMYAGDLDAALKDFEDAMKLRPDWPTPQANHGYASCIGNDFAGGKDDVDAALKRLGTGAPAADRAAVHYAHGSCLVLMGRTAPAIDDFTATIDADAGDSAALVARGLARAELKDLAGAKADLDHAHALKPDTAAIEKARSRVDLAAGDLAGAVEAYEHANALQEPTAAELNHVCAIRTMLGQSLDKALAECDESLRQKPDYAAALDSRATVNLRLGRMKEAVDDATAAIERKPDLASSYFVRAVALRKLGVTEAASRDLARARELDPAVEQAFAGFGVTP